MCNLIRRREYQMFMLYRDQILNLIIEIDDIVDENPVDYARKEMKEIFNLFENQNLSDDPTTVYSFVSEFKKLSHSQGMKDEFARELLYGVCWDLDHSQIDST